MVTWQSQYAAAADRLGSRTEARWLVEEAATGAWPALLDETVSERARRYFERMVDRRAAGEPLQYVVGRWPFRRLDLLVDRRVLIPRPETEQVVEVALAELSWLAGFGGDRRERVVVDLGTGSGAIALSLAAEGDPTAVWATDASADALHIARANLVGLGGSRAAKVRLVEGSWWDALPRELAGRVGLAVSNPPYVSTAEMADLPAVVAEWEPQSALHSGPTGLEAISLIVSQAPGWLSRPGSLVVELAPHQASEASRLAQAAGFDEVRVAPDLSGRDRALVARFVAPAAPG
jgi:release factor glutamine methyltransferase